jgi:predicted dehydrogenase
MDEPQTLRIGCLGAARIVPAALLRPAKKVPGVQVAAIAARDPQRAAEYAEKRAIPTAHASYAELIADDSLDAVYIPLPNGLHGRWTIAALEAGRHVLCEKPFAANADEAREVATVAERTGLVAMEAFHWRYHPLAERLAAIVASGELGEIERIDSTMCFPLYRRDDIRWSVPLAGGAMMDAGCYPVSIVRFLAGSEPKVTAARALQRSPGIDRLMEVELSFANGASGRIVTSLWSHHVLGFSVRVVGERATMYALNPFSPQVFHRLTVRGHGANRIRRREHVRGMSTYAYQLDAFRAAVLAGGPNPTSPADAIANMQVIDDAYRAAGLEPRLPTPA